MSFGTAQTVEVADACLPLRDVLGQRLGMVCLISSRGNQPNIACTAAELGAGAIGIIPAGDAAARLWKVLPAGLAALATSPLNGAVVVFPTDLVMNCEETCVWEFLVRQSSRIQVLPATPEHEIAAVLPRLSGEERQRPAWLNTRFRAAASGSGTHAQAVLAGLLLMHDQLDASHQISQQLEGVGADHPGDYWHAIMHRREGDFGNSKYWLRQVGQHPVFEQLAPVATQIAQRSREPAALRWLEKLVSRSRWQPAAFVDLCESIGDEDDSPLGQFARELQWAEMTLLLADNHRRQTS